MKEAPEDRQEQPQPPTPPKKPYQKPELRRVQLRPEEAVLGACKTSGSGSGPGGICGMTCSDAGS